MKSIAFAHSTCTGDGSSRIQRRCSRQPALMLERLLLLMLAEALLHQHRHPSLLLQE